MAGKEPEQSLSGINYNPSLEQDDSEAALSDHMEFPSYSPTRDDTESDRYSSGQATSVEEFLTLLPPDDPSTLERDQLLDLLQFGDKGTRWRVDLTDTISQSDVFEPGTHVEAVPFPELDAIGLVRVSESAQYHSTGIRVLTSDDQNTRVHLPPWLVTHPDNGLGVQSNSYHNDDPLLFYPSVDDEGEMILLFALFTESTYASLRTDQPSVDDVPALPTPAVSAALRQTSVETEAYISTLHSLADLDRTTWDSITIDASDTPLTQSVYSVDGRQLRVIERGAWTSDGELSKHARTPAALHAAQLAHEEATEKLAYQVDPETSKLCAIGQPAIIPADS